MKKGCMIAAGVGLVLLLVLGAVIYMVFQFTAPMVTAGEKFLASLGSGTTESAYAMTSATLRAAQTQQDFARTVKSYGLDSFQSASWSNRNVSNDRGTLEGTATTKSGGAVPLTIEMIKENGTWKVLSIKGPQTGASTGPIIAQESAPPALAAPPADEAARLALASLLLFNEAVQAKSFVTFHAGISKLWQEQITPAKLLEIFQPFITAQIDLAAIKPVNPVFNTPPAVNADGVLLLDGHYPTTPNKVYFKLKYVAENKLWMLIGVNVNVND
jgi:hypothetical protein